MFEQSGTFKREFIKLGVPALDIDIQNNYGETDIVCDLFAEIETAYRGGRSIFDTITREDIIFAFFPCIYFCENNQLFFMGKHMNLARLDAMGKADAIIDRARKREHIYELCLKLFALCDSRGLRLIVENPHASVHYLVNNFPYVARVIDKDRTRRGDYFTKPTQYFFVNCEPTEGFTEQQAREHRTVRESGRGPRAGICSAERSTISPDYARNFICDTILGVAQPDIDLQLF